MDSALVIHSIVSFLFLSTLPFPVSPFPEKDGSCRCTSDHYIPHFGVLIYSACMVWLVPPFGQLAS